MIGFSIMMWFVSVILLITSTALLKGNYSMIHGKEFEAIKDKTALAKACGRRLLPLGIGIAAAGVLALLLSETYAIAVSMLLILVLAGITLVRIFDLFRETLRRQENA